MLYSQRQHIAKVPTYTSRMQYDLCKCAQLVKNNMSFVSAENLLKDFSEVPTYSVRSLFPVLCAMAAGSGTGRRGKFVFAVTNLTNDGVKCVVDVVT